MKTIELIELLRSKTHLGRLSEGEVMEVLHRLEEHGYSVVKKDAPKPSLTLVAADPDPEAIAADAD